jgi:hypothetical protein
MEAQAVTGIVHVDATTYGDTIYLNSKVFDEYQNEGSDGIALIAHELGHVIEQDSYKGWYVRDYFREGSKNGFGRQNRLETRQYQIEDKVTAFLNGHLLLLVKIANGLPLTEAEKEQIRNVLGNSGQQTPKHNPKPKPKPKPHSQGVNDFSEASQDD